MSNNKQLKATRNNQACGSREHAKGLCVPCNGVTPGHCFYKVTYRLWLTQEWDYIIFDAKNNADAVETARAKLHSVWLRQGDFTVKSFTISTVDKLGEIIDVTTLNDNIDYLYEDDCIIEDWENDFDYENYCPYRPELDDPTLTQDDISKIELPF